MKLIQFNAVSRTKYEEIKRIAIFRYHLGARDESIV